jgi:hypothetical protein
MDDDEIMNMPITESMHKEIKKIDVFKNNDKSLLVRLNDIGKTEKQWKYEKKSVEEAFKRLVEDEATVEMFKVVNGDFYTLLKEEASKDYLKYNVVQDKYKNIWGEKDERTWRKWSDDLYRTPKVDDLKKPEAKDDTRNYEMQVAYAFRKHLNMKDVQVSPTGKNDKGMDCVGPDSKVIVQVKSGAEVIDREKIIGTFHTATESLESSDWTKSSEWTKCLVAKDIKQNFIKKAPRDWCLFELRLSDNPDYKIKAVNDRAEELVKKHRLNPQSLPVHHIAENAQRNFAEQETTSTSILSSTASGASPSATSTAVASGAATSSSGERGNKRDRDQPDEESRNKRIKSQQERRERNMSNSLLQICNEIGCFSETFTKRDLWYCNRCDVGGKSKPEQHLQNCHLEEYNKKRKEKGWEPATSTSTKNQK